jgi:hypothetical protein
MSSNFDITIPALAAKSLNAAKIRGFDPLTNLLSFCKIRLSELIPVIPKKFWLTVLAAHTRS